MFRATKAHRLIAPIADIEIPVGSRINFDLRNAQPCIAEDLKASFHWLLANGADLGVGGGICHGVGESFPCLRNNDASNVPPHAVAYREHHGMIMRRISMAQAGIIEK